MSGPVVPAEPPRLAEKILRRSLPAAPASLAILGDLREDYAEVRAERSRWAADLWYWTQVLSLSVRFAGRRSRARRGAPSVSGAGGSPRGSSLDGLTADVRLAARTLTRSRAFTLTAVGTLAVGIAGTTAVFSVLQATLLRSLPYPDSEALVYGRGTFDGRLGSTTSYLDYVDYRDQSDVFASLSLIRSGLQSETLTGAGVPERVPTNWITVDFFRTLGVAPRLGRDFTAAEAEPGTPWVAMISHGFWQRFFGGSPSAVGSTLTLGGDPTTVIGVMPASFRFRDDADIWLPVRFGDMDTRGRDSNSWTMVGRLGPGVTMEQAQSQVDVIARQLAQAYPETHATKGAKLTPLGEALAEGYRPSLLVLMGATLLLLAIACGNVAGLVLARATTRTSEISLRAALGASRGRLVTQLFTESMAIALVAGALGSLSALWLQRALLVLMPIDALGVREIGLSYPMLTFAVVTSMATAVVFGVGPALAASRVDPARHLHGGTRHTAGSATGRARAGMVVLQVALTVVLLTGSGLLLRSFLELRSVDVGFDASDVLAVGISIPGEEYSDAQARLSLLREIAEDVEALPGVTSASFINMVPFRHPYMDWCVWDPEHPPETYADGTAAYSRTALPGYFRTMGVPLLEGRDHTYEDATESPGRVILNESLAQRVFPGTDAVGRTVMIFNFVDEPSAFEVIGVAADFRTTSLQRNPFPQFYLGYASASYPYMNLMVHGGLDLEALAGPVRSAIHARDQDVLVSYALTMDEVVSASWWSSRLLNYAVGVFAVIAVLLAVGGVYGILAFQVARRTHEIGIRVALGATSTHVMRSVLRQGLLLVGGGLVLGLPVALAATGILQRHLYEIEPGDPVTYGLVTACFFVVGALACVVPAGRALQVDPGRALGTE